MKYEIVHDIIANQVFRKASEVQRRRQQAKKYVEGRYSFFMEDRPDDADSDNTTGLLTADELRKIDAYKDEINFSEATAAFIETSRKALATAEQLELERMSAALTQEKINAARELSLAAHHNKMQEQIIWRTRIGVTVASALCLLIFIGGFAAQSAYWKAKASEAVARAVRAYNVDGDITAMYGYALDAMYNDGAAPESQQQFYHAAYDSDRRHLLYYTNSNSDAQIQEENGLVSPTERYFVAPSNDSTTVLYDLTTIDGPPITLNGTYNTVGMAFAVNDHYIAIASENSVKIYNLATQKVIKTFEMANKKEFLGMNIKYIHANKDDSFTIVGDNLVAKWWFLTQNKPQILPLPTDLPALKINTATISQDGRFLIMENDGESLYSIFVLAFTPKGLVQIGALSDVVSSSFDETQSRLVVLKDNILMQYNLSERVKKGINGLQNPDFEFAIASTSLYQTTLLSNTFITSHETVDSIFGITARGIVPIGSISKKEIGEKQALRYSAYPDTNYLVVSYQNKAFLYNKKPFISDKSCRKLVGHTNEIIFRQVLPQSNRVLTVGRDGNIKTWQMYAPCVFDLNYGNFTQHIAHTEFSKSEKYILTVEDQTNLVHLWATASPEYPIVAPRRASLSFACFSPDNRSMIMPVGNKFEVYAIDDLDNKKSRKLEKTTEIDLNAPILWCKLAESGENILAITYTGRLVSLNANNSMLPITVLADTDKAKNAPKNILHLTHRIDSAATSNDGRYVLIYTQNDTYILDTKAGNFWQRNLKITTGTPLAVRFSPKIDRLMVATQIVKGQVKIRSFQTSSLTATRDSFLISGTQFDAASLQYGKVSENILYKQNGLVHIYYCNTGETTLLNTDFLRYHATSDKWMISFANKVSLKHQPKLFGVYANLNSAIKALEQKRIAVLKEGKKYNNALTNVVSSQNGNYWAVLQNNTEGEEYQNIFTMYDKNSALIAQMSALQLTDGTPFRNAARLYFSPKGNYLYAQNTDGGMKLWYWNVGLIKANMKHIAHK
jgi:WD40 repeat protein